jgi:hypothetical protein
MDKKSFDLVQKANRLGWSNDKLGKKLIEQWTGVKGGVDGVYKEAQRLEGKTGWQKPSVKTIKNMYKTQKKFRR